MCSVTGGVVEGRREENQGIMLILRVIALENLKKNKIQRRAYAYPFSLHLSS